MRTDSRFEIVRSIRGSASRWVLLALASVLVLLPSRVFAETYELALDSTTTTVRFVLDATAHKVHGRLFVTSGQITFDPVTGDAEGAIEIDARLTDTGNPRRDRKMHSSVLLSETHPVIRFNVEKIVGEVALQGSSEFELHGTIELLGMEHASVLETSATIDQGTLHAQAALVVPYVDWGLKDPSAFVLRVAKSVDVSIVARGELTRSHE